MKTSMLESSTEKKKMQPTTTTNELDHGGLREPIKTTNELECGIFLTLISSSILILWFHTDDASLSEAMNHKHIKAHIHPGTRLRPPHRRHPAHPNPHPPKPPSHLSTNHKPTRINVDEIRAHIHPGTRLRPPHRRHPASPNPHPPKPPSHLCHLPLPQIPHVFLNQQLHRQLVHVPRLPIHRIQWHNRQYVCRVRVLCVKNQMSSSPILFLSTSTASRNFLCPKEQLVLLKSTGTMAIGGNQRQW